MIVEKFLTDYGYWALFLGTLLEGETIVIIAGFLAFSGYMNLYYVITISFFGSFFSDQVLFYFGRYKGMAIVNYYPKWRQRVVALLHLIHRHQNWLILGFRFAYGFRIITPILIGASKISAIRYLVLNAMGALTWAIAISALGYMMGKIVLRLFHNLHHIEIILLAAILSLIALVWLLRLWRKNR